MGAWILAKLLLHLTHRDYPRKSPRKISFCKTIVEVMNAQLRAKLVVLSCCHSGRGEIKAEGVVGMVRAFMGAGARSVLVSLWAIDDKATFEFMKCFYHHLTQGKRSSESLNLATKSLRESENFNKIKFWAPFWRLAMTSLSSSVHWNEEILN